MEVAIDAIVEKLEGVSSLDPNYCKQCRTSEYANFEQLSAPFDCDLYSHEDLPMLLVQVAQKVRTYCAAQPDATSFFESLRAAGMDVSKLTTFLWYCIDSGLQADKTKRSLQIAINASNLYFVLSSIKSAKLYHLFDVNLFQKCIELLRNTEKLLRPLASKVANILQPKKRGAAPEQERNDPLGIGNSVEYFVTQLKNTMRSFFVALHSHSVADAVLENDERCPMVVDFLRDVAYFDIDNSTNFKKRSLDSVDSINRLSDLSFAITQEILSKRSEIRSLTVASRFVMPYLLFWVCGSAKLTISGSLPPVLKDARTAMVRFLSSRVDSLTKTEMDCYVKVLKTLPLKCFDRAEYRANVSETFVDILTLIPQLAYFLIDDVYVLGRHTKTAHRSFAYEIVNCLLRKFSFDSLPDPPIPYDSLIMDENTVLNMDAIEDAEEVMDADVVEDVVDVEPDADGNEANGAEENVEEQPVEEQIPIPPFRRRAARSPDDLEYIRDGMSPKEAMLMLIITGLIDKFAKQKALQAVETLFKNGSCIPELCKMATKFVNENLEELNLVGRTPIIKEEPMDEGALQDQGAMEVERQQAAQGHYSDDLLHLLLKAFEDDKTIVCKHALSTCLHVLLKSNVFKEDLFNRCIEEIKLKTWDIAIQVRKQAAVCLRDLLLDKDIGRLEFVERAWLSGLLHQVVDNEQTVSHQATKFVTEHIVNGLLKPRPNPTWELMSVVEDDAEFTRYLAICFTEHANITNTAGNQRTGNVQQLIQQLVRLLVRVTKQDDCPASAWMLLAELSHRVPVDPECASDAWERLQLDHSNDRIPTYVAKILANRCNSLDVETRDALKKTIGRQIRHNEIAVPHISAICYAFVCLSKGTLPNGGKGNKEGMREIANFVQRYNKKVADLINATIFQQLRREIASRAGTATPSLASQNHPSQQFTQDATPEQIMRSVYTVGELIQYAPVKIDSIVFNLFKGIVASDKIDADVQQASQFMQPTSAKAISKSIRAAAVLALGKMCVVDEQIADHIVPILIRQLRQDSDHCVRNIILIAMADICTIGSAAVNMFGDILASCMRDPSVLIRKHAVFLVTTLIRDEYFKWTGQVVYFFLGALLDPEPSVCDQVHASLLNVLLPKFPNMLYNHFVEAMFHLNDVIHPAMAVMVKQEQENCPLDRDDRFTLFGNSRMDDRMKIYKFMISTFSDSQNLPLMCRISSEVFEAISEQALDIKNRNVRCLLLDALKIIRCKEIVLKLQTGKKAVTEEIEDETEEDRNMEAVAKDAIEAVFMRSMNQDILSRLFRLREYLKSLGDPISIDFAKNCHSTILDIFEHYLEYFDKIVGNDYQRREEIRDDLKRIRRKNV